MKKNEYEALLFRAPAEEARAVRRLAEADERPVAYVLRKALRTYLKANSAASARTKKGEVAR